MTTTADAGEPFERNDGVSEGNRKTALVIGAVAAAAGIAVAAALLVKRRRAMNGPVDRTVNDVVTDCYSKIREIQRHLSELSSGALRSPAH
jgi:hypothetical protein